MWPFSSSDEKKKEEPKKPTMTEKGKSIRKAITGRNSRLQGIMGEISSTRGPKPQQPPKK